MVSLTINKIILLALLTILMLLVMFSSALAEVVEKDNADMQFNYVLTIEEGIISLDAKNTSLKQIFEEIGVRMGIEVEAMISDEEIISLSFKKLSLEDAIRKLSANHAYIIDSDKEKGQITKIVIV